MKRPLVGLPWIQADARTRPLGEPAGFDGLAALAFVAMASAGAGMVLVGWLLEGNSSWIASTLAMATRGAVAWTLLAWFLRLGASGAARSDDAGDGLLASFGVFCWGVAIAVPIGSAMELHVGRNVAAAVAMVDGGAVSLGPAGGAIGATLGALALACALAVVLATCNRFWSRPISRPLSGVVALAVVGNVAILMLNHPDLLIASQGLDGRSWVTWSASMVRGLPFLALLLVSLRLENIARVPVESRIGWADEDDRPLT